MGNRLKFAVCVALLGSYGFMYAGVSLTAGTELARPFAAYMGMAFCLFVANGAYIRMRGDETPCVP